MLIRMFAGIAAFSRISKICLLLLSGGTLCLSSCTTSNYQPLPLECKAGGTEPGAPPSFHDDFPISIADGNFNPGFTTTGWWVRASVSNPESRPKHLVLALNNPHINHLIAYVDGAQEPAFETGDFKPFYNRPVIDRDLLIPLEVGAGDTTRVLLWMDKIGESLQIQAELYSLDKLHIYRQDEALAMGMILGWMLFITLFGIFIFLSVRQLTYLYYVLYVVAATMWMVAQWGIGFRYLWPLSDDFPSKARPIFMMLNAVFFLVVLITFFPPTARNRLWSIVIRSLCATGGVLVVVALLFRYQQFTPGFKLFFLNAGHFVIIAAIICAVVYLFNAYKDGERLTIYYFLAIGLVLCSGLFLNLLQYGLHLPMERFVNTYSSSIGLLGETTLITFALSQRYNLYKKEKERLAISLLEKEKEHATRLVETEEEERKRIGRDLHDTLGGLLSAVKLSLEKLKHQQPGLKGTLDPLEELNDQSIAELRSISHNLVPVNLSERGLENVLQHLLKRLTDRTKINFHLYFNVNALLEETVAVHIYRICFELMNNAIKHAAPTEVNVQVVEESGGLLVIVEDDGKGFAPESNRSGIGLMNLRHRVAYLKGTLSIDSNNKGTTVIINLPLYIKH